MKPVPRALLERLQDLAPPGAEVVPLEWAYDGEDYHLTVFVDEEEDQSLSANCCRISTMTLYTL